MWRTDMRHGGDCSARYAGATVFSRLSRRRHIDLKRSTSCLCPA
ncbi:putative leader peptide [Streptomyces ipomoeae]|nr:putative leader peptide [Streptomyces ipomoeae]